jgi:MerR family transcriptional regulator/heat shock protein HspR
MARKYFRITEVVKVCSVSKRFVLSLEREDLITPVVRRKEKVYPLKEVDRIRVAQILVEEMGVNFEGVEVVLHMREQIINMRHQMARLMAELPKDISD